MADLVGRYFLWQGRVLYIGRGGKSALHRHHMLQIGVSFGRSIRVRTSDSEPFSSFQGLIIWADRPHQVITSSREPVIFLWIDPEDDMARRLRVTYDDTVDTLPIPEPALVSLLDKLADLPLQSDGCDAAHDIVGTILCHLVPESPAPPLDERVSTVLQVLRELRDDPMPPVEELARTVFLSPSRLMHLFREQAGLPIRRYGLWRRLLRALRRMSEGASITEAAHATAFSDAAHLTRTFRAMLGVTPSELFKNSRFIQATACYDT